MTAIEIIQGEKGSIEKGIECNRQKKKSKWPNKKRTEKNFSIERIGKRRIERPKWQRKSRKTYKKNG